MLSVSPPPPPTTEHRLVASSVGDDGITVACACGWSTTVGEDPVGVLDAWAEHCIATAPLRS